MTRVLSVGQVLRLHEMVMAQAQASAAVRDLAALESAVAQPRMTFSGEDLYPTVSAKAAALGFSLIRNHPFVDGNKRVGHAALEVMLSMNGFELQASIDDAERVILGVAAGELDRTDLLAFIERHVRKSG